MAMPMYEYELEALPEFEEEYEYEGEWEGEFESEEFFRRLAGLATAGGMRRSPLRRVALAAARAALRTGLWGLGTLLGVGRGRAPAASGQHHWRLSAGGLLPDSVNMKASSSGSWRGN